MKNITLLLSLYLTINLNAQRTIIRGKIYDAQSHQPLPFANITVPNSNIGVISNSQGIFQLSLPDSMKHDSIEISFIGYQSQQFLVDKITEAFTCALEPQAFEMADITVRSIEQSPEDVIDSMKAWFDNTHKQELLHQRCFFHSDDRICIDNFDIDIKKSTVKGVDDHFIDALKEKIPEETYTYSEYLFDVYGQKILMGKLLPIEAIQFTDSWDVEKEIMADIEQLNTSFFDANKSYKMRSGIIPIKVNNENKEKYEEEQQKPDSLHSVADTLQKKNSGEDSPEYLKIQLSSVHNQARTNIIDKDESYWDFLHKKNLYNYSFTNNTVIDGTPVRVISFSPKKNSAKFKGKIYISDIDYALVQLSTEFAPEKSELSINILGVSYKQEGYKSLLRYEKYDENYRLKFFHKEENDRVGINRPFSIKERENEDGGKRAKIKADLMFEMVSSFTTQLMVVSSDLISSANMDEIQEPELLKVDTINAYSPERWSKYSIIEPSQSLQNYTKQFD